ncbi:hypothetical protein QM806_06715 [Rhodococcus sp. IEGM 1351]|uniref:hypothetical protein n=1 Tax=Rhodococcus sp. IEGM 1351 TaxID=3047089 RepID=UPI0024B663DD|nr:hypothetical protein [Rhodococcus sp. IEGM 1351]MDI9935143.1 hypothetical protein [Rhodococcus sp. IEGM 1351]
MNAKSGGTDDGQRRRRSGTGRLLAEVPHGRLSGDPLHSTTLKRGSLVEVLRECAEQAGVRIVTGRRLVGAEPTGHGVRAQFADGSSATRRPAGRRGWSLVGYPVGP